jgi:hypothetical protein
MGPFHARVVGARSGEDLAAAAVFGCYDLMEVPGGDHFVSVRDGRLCVLDGRTYEELYAREEGAGGCAWIKRGRTYSVVDGDALANTVVHLARAGVSRPVDCFEPWLLDPLGVAAARLDHLPDPPHIVEGPERVLSSSDPKARLEVRCAGAHVLEVEVAHRVVRVVPLDGEGRASVEVAAPWPADIRLRARARTGARSAPWRVRIDPAH